MAATSLINDTCPTQQLYSLVSPDVYLEIHYTFFYCSLHFSIIHKEKAQTLFLYKPIKKIDLL